MNSFRRALRQWLSGRRHYRFLARHFLPPGDADAAVWLHGTLRHSGHLRTEEMPPPGGRILVLAPHPDDEVLGPGGTLLGAGGSALAVVYLTSGQAPEAALREAEARAVCEELGAQAHFLRLTDGALETDAVAAEALRRLLADFRPDVLMLPFMLDDHPDHRRASLLLDAACAELSVEPEIWAYQVYSALIANVVVDISPWHERKAALIRRYASQCVRRDWANFSLGLNAWNSRFLKARGASWAEAFLVLPIAEYRRLVGQYAARLTKIQ